MLNVIALGGNAILETDPTDQGQKNMVQKAASYIADFVEKGEQVVICHGNGPQVGNLLLQQKAVDSEKNPAFKLDSAVAMTEGSIGYWIQNALHNEFARRQMEETAVTMVTQVVVSHDDPAFINPTKPIGPFYTEEEAEIERQKSGGVFKEDAGRGYRKYVPSPIPQSIVEVSTIEKLIKAGIIPICAGGGGVPVVEEANGSLIGVEAVIDKDLAAKVVAENINADKLIILTAVDNIHVNFNKPDQKALEKITIEEAEEYIEQGQFAPGSMLPKVQAAVAFVGSKEGREAVITSLENLSNLDKGVGTIITDRM